MEDRHVVLHDVNALFGSMLPKDEPQVSFYAVYDGHAGKDAAAFAASHLHANIFQSEHYPTDVVKAITEAFTKTDKDFLDKGQKEVTNCT